jgi:hypothetical protein
MKLDHYVVSQHIKAHKWQAVTDAIAAHFGLTMPQNCEIEFTDRLVDDPKVAIYYGDMVYCWSPVHGFSSATLAREGRFMAMTYARIYLPASMFGANKQP